MCFNHINPSFSWKFLSGKEKFHTDCTNSLLPLPTCSCIGLDIAVFIQVRYLSCTITENVLVYYQYTVLHNLLFCFKLSPWFLSLVWSFLSSLCNLHEYFFIYGEAGYLHKAWMYSRMDVWFSFSSISNVSILIDVW